MALAGVVLLDRMPQHRQHAAGARLGSPPRNRDPRRGWRRAAAASSGNCSPSRSCSRSPARRRGCLLAFWSTRLLFGTLAPLLPLTITFEPTPDVNVLIAATVLAAIRGACSSASGRRCAARASTSSTT